MNASQLYNDIVKRKLVVNKGKVGAKPETKKAADIYLSHGDPSLNDAGEPGRTKTAKTNKTGALF